MILRIAGIVPESITDGPGIRFVIFTQGCPHNCPGCHNPETHDFKTGSYVDTDTIFAQILSNPYIKNITFSGGEPFCQAEQLTYLAKMLKKDNYHIMSYTGYLFEDLIKNPENLELLKNIDILIDGKFMIEQRNLKARFKGSDNQRIIDVQKSLKENKIILADI